MLPTRYTAVVDAATLDWSNAGNNGCTIEINIKMENLKDESPPPLRLFNLLYRPNFVNNNTGQIILDFKKLIRLFLTARLSVKE